jgi:hypothetical protein
MTLAPAAVSLHQLPSTVFSLLTTSCSASYLSFSMIFQTHARTRLQQEQVSSTGQPPLTELGEEDSELRSRMAHEYLSNTIMLAHRSAQMLQDFRERFGLKIVPGLLLQLQAVAAGVLIHDPDLAHKTAASTTDGDSTINNSRAAFDEVFRCLLGTGVESILARGIARMTYQTALQYQAVLSTGILSMLEVMAETAWRPSDVTLMKSIFPNFATTRGHDDHEERLTELLTKWEPLQISDGSPAA